MRAPAPAEPTPTPEPIPVIRPVPELVDIDGWMNTDVDGFVENQDVVPNS